MDRLISEQAVIDAICKVCAVEVKPSECRYRKGLFGGCKEYEAIKAIPSAEPCDDAISREAVLEKAVYTETEEGWCGYTVDVDYIKSLPSVIPQPKTGHWIYDRTRDWDGECKYECSECGMGSDVDYDYCMRCGTRMVEPQERSDKE